MSAAGFAILGWVLGILSVVVTDTFRSWRRRIDLLRLISTEAKALLKTCESALQNGLWMSSDTRRVADMIQQAFLKDRERWSIWETDEGPVAVVNFYLDCAGLLDLMRLEEERKSSGASVGPAIDRSTYEALIQRTQNFVEVTRNERQLWCRACRWGK